MTRVSIEGRRWMVPVLGTGVVVVIVALAVRTMWPSRSDATRIGEDVAYDTTLSADESIDAAIQRIRDRFDRSSLRIEGDAALTRDEVNSLSSSFLDELAVYWSGDVSRLMSHAERHERITALPDRLMSTPGRLEEVWRATRATFAGARLDLGSLVIRPRFRDGRVQEVHEPVSSTAHRPGRIAGLPENPEEGGFTIFEVVLPAEIRGRHRLGHEVVFPGRWGLWFVRLPDGSDWLMYKMTVYDVPNEVAVAFPPL